jgi:hypothetical protein
MQSVTRSASFAAEQPNEKSQRLEDPEDGHREEEDRLQQRQVTG